MTSTPHTPWPSVPALADWQDTLRSLHMWTQVVGKVRLARTPWLNHSWGSALYVTTEGLSTSPIHDGVRTFSIDFDFLAHELVVRSVGGKSSRFSLEPMSVADFYGRTMNALAEVGVRVDIYTKPVEVEDAVRFEEDTREGAYDGKAVVDYWRAMHDAHRVFQRFRAGFTGKVSPVHFFWGAFDLAVTRFSGRAAPEHPGGAPNCADWVMVEAYSHELSSAGFWPGTGLGEAAFYSYAYPAPDGFAGRAVQPETATYHQDLGEFVLPYEAVRTSSDPDETLLSFLESTYAAAAELGDWGRGALEFPGAGSPAMGIDAGKLKVRG